MRDEGRDYEISNLIARMPGEGGAEATPQAMLLWLIDLFRLWNEGADQRVEVLRGDIARRVGERSMVPVTEIPADPPPASREERGWWVLRLALAILSSRGDYGDPQSLANNCRRFLVHANAWVRGA